MTNQIFPKPESLQQGPCSSYPKSWVSFFRLLRWEPGETQTQTYLRKQDGMTALWLMNAQTASGTLSVFFSNSIVCYFQQVNISKQN